MAEAIREDTLAFSLYRLEDHRLHGVIMSDDGKDELPRHFRDAIDRSRANSRGLRRAMEAWAANRGGMGAGGAHDGYGELTFHWPVDESQPRAELTFWADLNDDDRPVIRVTFPEGYEPEIASPSRPVEVGGDSTPAMPATDMGNSVSSSSVVYLRSSDLPLVEPDQQCEACGAQGTVARASRYERSGDLHEMHRFCAECWPEERARYEARWRQQSRRETDAHRWSGELGTASSMSTAFESATWDIAEGMIDSLQEPAMMRGRATQRELRRFADEIFDMRDSRVGKMPFAVAMFIRTHTSRTLPADFLTDWPAPW